MFTLIASSAWKIPFNRAINAFPIFKLQDLLDEQKGVACEACTHGKSRHSLFKLELEGDIYDRKKYEPLKGFSDDSEDDSDESDTSEKVPLKRVFNLGSSCAGRALGKHYILFLCFNPLADLFHSY